jgi:hypothetical protein
MRTGARFPPFASLSALTLARRAAIIRHVIRGVSHFLSALREERTSGRRAVLGLALALFAAFFGFTLLVNDPTEAPSLIYAIPIGLLALEFGVAAGLIGALAAMALFTSAVLIEDQMIGPVGFLTRALAFAFAGAGVGLLAARLRGSEARVRSILEGSHEGLADLGPFELTALVGEQPDQPRVGGQ